jgi:integrase
MKIIKIYKKDLPNDINYLDLTNNKFIFNNYKTNKTYKQQIFDINDDLMNIINLYLKYHPNKKELKDKKITYFIVDFNGLPFKHVNDITKRLNKIFGKNIGVSMLRKIYLTEKYKDTNDEMKQDAEAMGTSTNTIENNYLKND